MPITQKPRINPSEYNELETDRISDALTAEVGYSGLKEDFLRDELNLARKISAFNAGTDILTFTLAAETGEATIDADEHTVDIEVADGTTLTALEPVITLSTGATVDPESEEATNFTNAVTYTVTAADGTEQEWTVTVTEAAE